MIERNSRTRIAVSNILTTSRIGQTNAELGVKIGFYNTVILPNEFRRGEQSLFIIGSTDIPGLFLIKKV